MFLVCNLFSFEFVFVLKSLSSFLKWSYINRRMNKRTNEVHAVFRLSATHALVSLTLFYYTLLRTSCQHRQPSAPNLLQTRSLWDGSINSEDGSGDESTLISVSLRRLSVHRRTDGPVIYAMITDACHAGTQAWRRQPVGTVSYRCVYIINKPWQDDRKNKHINYIWRSYEYKARPIIRDGTAKVDLTQWKTESMNTFDQWLNTIRALNKKLTNF